MESLGLLLAFLQGEHRKGGGMQEGKGWNMVGRSLGLAAAGWVYGILDFGRWIGGTMELIGLEMVVEQYKVPAIGGFSMIVNSYEMKMKCERLLL
jgi:hypothetical protein